MFWAVGIALTILAGLWVAFPFLRKGSVEINDSDGAISVFRDQLDELDRDRVAGLISAEEHDAARQEIEWRTLSAARHLDGGIMVSHRSLIGAGALAAVAVALTMGGYLFQGSPELPDQPLAARKTEVLERQAASGDLNARIALLIERTKDNPESFEDWWTLATAYTSIGDDVSSVEAYRQAAALEPNEPGVQAALGEAMTLANGNKVPPAARIIFETVLRDTPDPRARYYLALAEAQDQNFEAALGEWMAMLQDTSPTAPWVPLLRRDIVNMVRFLGYDLTDFLPDATAAEITAAGGASDDEVNTARVAELQAKIAEDPMDYKDWIELAERLAQSGDNKGASLALTQGAAHFPGAPFIQQKFDQTARALGMQITGSSPVQDDDAVAQPSADDVASITAMDQDDQDALIEGMVAGLAAQLEESPDNPEKWVMLVRSYAVLGDLDKANNAYAKARGHFEGNDAVLGMLATGVADVIVE